MKRYFINKTRILDEIHEKSLQISPVALDGMNAMVQDLVRRSMNQVQASDRKIIKKNDLKKLIPHIQMKFPEKFILSKDVKKHEKNETYVTS